MFELSVHWHSQLRVTIKYDFGKLKNSEKSFLMHRLIEQQSNFEVQQIQK